MLGYEHFYFSPRAILISNQILNIFLPEHFYREIKVAPTKTVPFTTTPILFPPTAAAGGTTVGTRNGRPGGKRGGGSKKNNSPDRERKQILDRPKGKTNK